MELAPGLHRWTTRHEEWEEEVGSLAVDTPDGLVLIDPLAAPPEMRDAAHVLITVFFHARDAGKLPRARVWARAEVVRRLANRGVEVTDAFGEDAELPGGIRAFPTPRRGEVVYWLPEQRALAPGDVLLGAGAKPRRTDDPLRLCPERWIANGTHDDLRAALRPLLDLPVELVLPSHGAPVLADGRAALEAVLL